MRIIRTFAAILALGVANGQGPGPAKESDNHSAMVHRGNQVMGFPAVKTKHHFRLFQDGGAIEVAANDPQDAESREQIRVHLSRLASMFSEGNFNAPMLIHDTTPPGVNTMIKLSESIRYDCEDTASGARIRIKTRSAQALDAIHAFLLFQIIEHHTGDSASIQ